MRVTITDGERGFLTAIGGQNGTGIGSGNGGGKGGDEFFENDGNIHISGGEITAIGGEGSVGIGGGNHKNGGNITIGGNR